MDIYRYRQIYTDIYAYNNVHMHMTKSYDIYTVLYLGCMSVIYVYMTLKIHANISICICMYDPINTGTYEHSGSLMFHL